MAGVAMPIGIQGGLGHAKFWACWKRLAVAMPIGIQGGLGLGVTRWRLPTHATSQCRSAFKAGWDRFGGAHCGGTRGVAMPIGIQGGLGRSRSWSST